MPYNYTLAWNNSQTGRPLAMPLNYFEPANTSVANVNDEFLWGENMLIAPVLFSGQTSRNVLFPSGKWLNYWTNQSYQGNSASNVSAPLDKMPVFIKAGSFIPLVPPYNNTSKYNTDTLIVKYYPDDSNPSTSFTMYDDDGTSPDANIKGNYELITFKGDVQTHETYIYLSKSGNGFSGSPAARKLMFQVQRFVAAPYGVYINGKQINKYSTQQTYLSADTAAYYDSQSQVLNIKYSWKGTSDLIFIANDNHYTGTNNSDNASFYLQHAYPNPFSNFTAISYNILEKGNYCLNIYNAEGALIQTFQNTLNPGSYTYSWHGKDAKNNDLPPGLYIVSLSGQALRQWIKVIKY
jgi:hypothetical protein